MTSASSTSATLKVAKVATSVKYGGPTSMAHGATVTLSATLKTSAGVALAGQSVTFTLGGVTSTAITDASGVARVTRAAPATKGAYKVTVSFAGNVSYGASSSSSNIKVS